jgi:hypothetical protein
MGSDTDEKSTLNHCEILQVFRHACLSQLLFNVWEIASRPLKPHKNLRPVPYSYGKLSIQHLPNIAIFKRHRLTAKIYGFRKGKVIKDRIVCLLGRQNKGWMEYH